MSSPLGIDPTRFVSSVRPLLEARDLEGLFCHLKSNWSAEQIASLLSCKHGDAQKVAALALSLVGGKCCIPPLAQRLKDPCAMSNQMAEHALWSIWFRCGSPPANAELAKGAQCLTDRKFDCAFKHFAKAIALSPDFAEAYDQRGIAHYLQEDYEPAIDDFQRAAQLMPCHFGAWAGMGHCHAHLGRPREAIRCYGQALEINPHLECIQSTVAELERQLGETGC